MDALDAAAMGSPQLGPLSMGFPHAEVPLSTVVAGVEVSPQGSPQPLKVWEKKSSAHRRGDKEYLGSKRGSPSHLNIK